MALKDSFTDLAQRLGTGAAMALVGLLAVWAGGLAFTILIAAICGLLVWELVGMLGGGRRRGRLLGVAAGCAVFAAWIVPIGLGLPLVLFVAVAGLAALEHHRTTYMIFTATILVAGFGLLVHRDEFGVMWMLWLILVVGATDVLGYFCGRMIGGPKFWPQVSPKKTWSGTVAGWVGAGVVGAIFAIFTRAGFELVGISVALSMASQMGDIAESAMKRRMGVKDSSDLLPGHGGLFDRFDGMMGATLMLLLVEALAPFPPVPLA